jgi:hypothetical protein
MKRLVLRTSLWIGCLALLTAALQAADVTGKWTGDISTPDGNQISLTLNLKADGAKVTGTVTGPTGDTEIADGKMDGDTLLFVLNVDAGGQTLSFKVSGTLTSPDELKIKMDGGGDLAFEFTAKRAAS